MTNVRDRDDATMGAGSRGSVEKFVGQLVVLSRSDEACRLLGIDGVLVDQVDITVLDDPLDYVAYDIAAAVRDAAEDAPPVQATMLSTLVAEFRLCGLIASHIDQHDLVERVMRHLRELQG
jgi:hypothetical protein